MTEFSNNVIDFQASLKAVSPQINAWMDELKEGDNRRASLKSIRLLNDVFRALTMLKSNETDRNKLVFFETVELQLLVFLKDYQKAFF